MRTEWTPEQVAGTEEEREAFERHQRARLLSSWAAAECYRAKVEAEREAHRGAR